MDRTRTLTACRAAPWLFAFLLSASPAMSQGPAAVSSSNQLQPGRVLERLAVSADVRTTWDRVKACASETPHDTTRSLEQIVFMLRTPGPRNAAGGLTKGEWIPGTDTVYITQGYEHSGWIVAHEMLHFLLETPRDNPHPYVPFAFPCALWNDPTSDLPDEQLARDAGAGPASMVGGPTFSYPVLGFAVWIQGTLLAGHGWWRA